MKIVLNSGPIIPHVESIAADNGLFTVTFFTSTAAAIAHLATGWPYAADNRTLEAISENHALELRPPKDPDAPTQTVTTWIVAEDDAPALN